MAVDDEGGKTDGTENFVMTTSDEPVIDPAPTPTPDDKGGEPKKDEVKKPDPKPDEGKGGEVDKEKGKAPPGESSDSDATADKDKAKKPNRTQKRIDDIVRQREDEKRGREAAEKENAELKARLEASGKKPEPKESPKEPQQSDFASYDEYLDAFDAFEKATQDAEPAPAASPEKKEQPKNDGEESPLTDAQRTAMAITKEKLDGVEESFPDFKEVALAEDVPITGDMIEALAECDDPGKVMYHLGKNKELAAEIAGKSPAQQMRAIAKLDLSVDTKPPKPNESTKAPEPIDPVGGSDASEKPLEELSFSDYEKRQNKADQKGRGDGW